MVGRRRGPSITITLTTEAETGTKQESIDFLQQLIDQLPSSYLGDILQSEAGSILSAISQDLGFTDYAAQLREYQEHKLKLKEIQEHVEAARKELARQNGLVDKEKRRLGEIEETRRELRRLLAAV